MSQRFHSRFILRDLLKNGIIAHMNSFVQINPRRTLTLPKVLRKALGVAEGGVVIVDWCNNTVVLQH